MSPVQHAAFTLDLPGLKALRQRGTDLHGALLAAASAHAPDAAMQQRVIRYLTKHGVDVNERDANGVTPLHRAVRFRSVPAVKVLLLLGAEVNAVDRRSRSTPLHRAVTSTGAPTTKGKASAATAIIEILLDAGADGALKNALGKCAADYCADPATLKRLRHPGPARR